MSIVERIRGKCTEKGTSIKALEREIGLGNGTISRWDSNTPSYDKVIKVADFLQVSFNWLIFGKEAAELSPEEQLLIEYYRKSSSTGRRSTLGTAKMNSELMPAEQQSLTSRNGLTGTGDM